MMDVNFRTLDLNLLRVFDEIMAERNLTRAARNLSITQPAVSNALRRLRELLGDDLLRRDGAGVTPTPRALALWPVVRESLRQLQATISPNAFDPLLAENTFVLAMADATSAELVPGLVRICESEAPGVSVRVLPLATRDPRQLLEDEAADIAVGYFPSVLSDMTARAQSGAALAFEAQQLYLGQYVCVMRRDHPLADRPLTLDAFCTARHLLVSFSGRPWGFVDEALAAMGRERRIVLTVNQFFTAGRVVANSDLLTVLPRHFFSVTGAGDQLVMQELPMALPLVRVDALWHRRLHATPAHVWLRTTLVRSASDAFARTQREHPEPTAG